MLLDEWGPLRTRGKKRGTTPPLKRRYSSVIGSSNVKTVADRHKPAAYHINKHWPATSFLEMSTSI